MRYCFHVQYPSGTCFNLFSFTYYNVLESPKFIGLDNYINLILEDDVFLTGVKNTF